MENTTQIVEIEKPQLDTRWCRLFVVIQGTRPLLFNWRESMTRQAEWRTHHGRKRAPTPEEEAEMGCLRDPDTNAFLIRAEALLECAKKGGKELKVVSPTGGRAKSASAVLGAGVLAAQEFYPVWRPKPGVGVISDEGYPTLEPDHIPPSVDGFLELVEPITQGAIDTRRAVVQRAGVMRSRTRVNPPWLVLAEFLYDAGIGGVTYLPQHFSAALGYGGMFVGIGDYRIEKGGPFGGFEVVKVWAHLTTPVKPTRTPEFSPNAFEFSVKRATPARSELGVGVKPHE